MKIILLNVQLVEVIAAIQNARQFTEKISVPINLKLDEVIDEIRAPMTRFENRREQLMKDHIAQNENGTFKTQRVLDGTRWVFKSEEDEEKYLAVTEKELIFDLELLTKEEIMRLTTGKNQNGDSGFHLGHLKLITEGYANTPKRKTESKVEEE